jgi:hypothetical protein
MQKVPVHPFDPSALDAAYHRARADLHASEREAAAEEAASAAQDDFPDRLIMGHELLLAAREPSRGS